VHTTAPLELHTAAKCWKGLCRGICKFIPGAGLDTWHNDI